MERPDGSWRPADWPEVLTPDEPEGGWQTADPLYTTEVLAITLCKYTGNRIDTDGDRQPVCNDRPAHPDTSCIMQYWSAAAIIRGDVTAAMSSLVVRGDVGVDPTFVEPA